MKKILVFLTGTVLVFPILFGVCMDDLLFVGSTLIYAVALWLASTKIHAFRTFWRMYACLCIEANNKIFPE